MSYLLVFDYRINPSNNIFTYALSVDAIVLYLKDLQGRPKYAQFYVKIFISKTTLKSISSLLQAKLYHQNTKVKGVLCKGCARSIRDARSQAQQLQSLWAVHLVRCFRRFSFCKIIIVKVQRLFTCESSV